MVWMVVGVVGVVIESFQQQVVIVVVIVIVVGLQIVVIAVVWLNCPLLSLAFLPSFVAAWYTGLTVSAGIVLPFSVASRSVSKVDPMV